MDRRDILAAGLLATGLAAILLPFAPLGLNPHHDGIMLKPALDVWSGQALFRDTFSQYGPLTTYLQVVALCLQPTLLSLRLLTVATYAVSLFFFYAAWRPLLPRSLAILAGLMFILFVPVNESDYWGRELWPLLPWSSVFAMMFQAIGLHAFVQLLLGKQVVRQAIVVGTAVASVLWCRQPVGGIMAGCLVVVWLALPADGWRPAGHPPGRLAFRALTAFATVHVLMLVLIGLSGALPEWWRQNFVWPARWSGYVDWRDSLVHCVNPRNAVGLTALFALALLPSMLARHRPAWGRRILVVGGLALAGVIGWQHEEAGRILALRGGGWAAVLPAVVLAQAAISLWRRGARHGTPRTFEYYLAASLAAFSLGSLAQYYPAADPWHVLWALAPAFGLVVFSFWRWSGWRPAGVTLFLLAFFLPAIGSKIAASRRTLTQPLVRLERPAVLRGMRVTPSQAAVYGRIADALDAVCRQQPDIPAVLSGYDAIFLCFLTNLGNPTPYFVTWAALTDETDNARRLAYIHRVRPLMFFHRADWAAVNNFYRQARYVPVLYIAEEALEIAIPQELATRMGIGPYGLDHPPAKSVPMSGR